MPRKMDLICHLHGTSSSTTRKVTYLFLKGSGDQASQFRKAAVDTVSAPFLYNLKNDKNLPAATLPVSKVLQWTLTRI